MSNTTGGVDVDREQRKHKHKILRLVLRNVNVSRNIFIPASRFSSHMNEFFHALAKRKHFAEHFHSRVSGSYWQLLGSSCNYGTLLLAVTIIGSDTYMIYDQHLRYTHTHTHVS